MANAQAASELPRPRYLALSVIGWVGWAVVLTPILGWVVSRLTAPPEPRDVCEHVIDVYVGAKAIAQTDAPDRKDECITEGKRLQDLWNDEQWVKDLGNNKDARWSYYVTTLRAIKKASRAEQLDCLRGVTTADEVEGCLRAPKKPASELRPTPLPVLQ